MSLLCLTWCDTHQEKLEHTSPTQAVFSAGQQKLSGVIMLIVIQAVCGRSRGCTPSTQPNVIL